MSNNIKALIATAGLLLAVAVAAVLVLLIVSGGDPVNFIQVEFTRWSLAGRQEQLNRPIGTDETPRRFTVNPGDTPPRIAQNLYDASLISDTGLFVDYARVSGLDRQLEAGTYFLNQRQTIPEITLVLTDSRNSSITFSILEGWRLEEIAEAVDRNGLFGFTGAEFLRVVGPGAMSDTAFATAVGLPPSASLEGFLFPNTYALPPGITPEGLRDTLTSEFLSRITPQMAADAATQGWSLYEVATLASIIERESVHSDENPMISSVYRNRLNIAMKLDADPTVQYGIGYKDGRWWPQITQADYTNAVHDFNTYLVIGLPPGPIASAGLAALQAAIYPAQSDYLFFRAACNGSGYHNFARTFAEHLANGC